MWKDAVVSYDVCDCSVTTQYGRCRGESTIPYERELMVGCVC